ncbi:MAG: electron transfer flavoprotein-ubiquinone oxidoreductase, partial [Sphingomonadales bacterium]
VSESGGEISVCILEKGAEIGGHILSGAVLDPIALNELLPNWKELSCPIGLEVTDSQHWILSEKTKTGVPHFLMPPLMSNKGKFTLSLGNFCRWLGEQAENMGVEIYPGFAVSEILYRENGSVKGVATGDMGIAKDGAQKDSFEPGMELHAKYTFFAEGVRGSLSEEVIKKYNLREGVEPQTYGLGIKELWDVEPVNHKSGQVIHTQGWPLKETAGGGFIYHQENNQIAIGFVTALDYKNPYISPFEEFQRFKTHPSIKAILKGGRRVSYGARAINEGGFQSVPKLIFPGGAIIGCSAGFVNVPRIKGTHNAMKTGMMAADAAFDAIVGAEDIFEELNAYAEAYKSSWVYKDLQRVRNVRPALSKFGIKLGTIYSGFDMWLNSLGMGFLFPWTFKHREDHKAMLDAKNFDLINYPKPDNEFSFDKLTSVFLSNTNHEEDQPGHLTLRDNKIPVEVNLQFFDGPEQKFCPAGVYEFVEESGVKRLQINAQNCVHCKTCDIKDFSQNIKWVVPEGGGGPNYPNM